MKILATIPVIVLGTMICMFSYAGAYWQGNPTPMVLAAEDPSGNSSAPHTGYTFDPQALVGTAGVTGVLVWYLYYTTSIAFPKIRQDFRDEAKTEREHHEKLAEERGRQLEALIDKLGALGDELRIRPCILGKEKQG